uniref:(northern house mosquito) hypothetical protein n=1 Tax=Culex pipiens TaxID=7175 RepID=A0A8D8FWY6_CULPI
MATELGKHFRKAKKLPPFYAKNSFRMVTDSAKIIRKAKKHHPSCAGNSFRMVTEPGKPFRKVMKHRHSYAGKPSEWPRNRQTPSGWPKIIPPLAQGILSGCSQNRQNPSGRP